MILVGSVFTENPRNAAWYQQQIQFLEKTTDDFQHLVYLDGEVSCNFESSKLVESSVTFEPFFPDGRRKGENYNHSCGLRSLLTYFRNHPAEAYLFLDSDCFPVLRKWDQILLERIQAKNCKFAAPVRFDNLDMFPHPSALLIPGEFIEDSWIDFNLGEPGAAHNLMGSAIIDVGSRLPIKDCYPLLRSNVYNLHPLLAGVYNNMFYHHGCGSREVRLRSINEGYFDHYMDRGEHALAGERLFDELMLDPEEFINKLMSRQTNA